eukprot:gene6404-8815_t
MSLKQCCALGKCVETKNLKACSACSETFYCSREHQTEHFKEGHKMICPGKTKGTPLTFNECAAKATKYYTQQMWLAALPYYSAMLELSERSLGLFHPQVGSLLEVIANCYKNLERWVDAIGCLQRVIVIRELTNDESIEQNKALFSTMGLLSELYLQSGHIQLAKEMLLKMEEQAKESFGEDSFERGRTLCALAGCLERNDEREAAFETLSQAVRVKGYGESNDPVEMAAASNAFFNLGILYFNEEKKKDALVNFRKALEMKIKSGLNSDHPDIIESKSYVKQCQ